MKNNPKNKKNDNKKENKKIYIGLGILLAIVVIIIISSITFVNSKEQKDKELAYTDLIKEISSSNIEKVEMTVNSTKVKVKIN